MKGVGTGSDVASPETLGPTLADEIICRSGIAVDFNLELTHLTVLLLISTPRNYIVQICTIFANTITAITVCAALVD